MVSAVRKRLWQGLGANAYGTFVVAIVQLASVPILLHSWGATIYGEWLLLFAIPSCLSLTNLGFSLAVANDMTARVAHGDREGALVAYQSLLAFVSVIGVAATLLLLPLLYWFPLSGWLHITALAPAEVRVVLLLLSGQVLVQLLGGVSAAGFRASGEYGLGAALESTISLAQYGALWASVGAGFGPAGAAAAFFAIRVIGGGITLSYLSYRHSWLRLGIDKARFRHLRGLIRPSLANLTVTIAEALRNQGLVIVVGVLLGPLAVVIFSVLRTLTRIPLRLVASISRAIEPEIAVAEGQRDGALQRRLYLAGMQSSLWFSIFAGITLYFAGDVLLKFWTQGRVDMNHSLFIWLLASGVLAALWHVSLSVLVALNRQARAALVYVASAVLTVGVAFALVASTSRVAEIGLAMLIGEALLSGYMLWVAGRITGTPSRLLVTRLLNPIGPVWKVMAGQRILERPMRKLSEFFRRLS